MAVSPRPYHDIKMAQANLDKLAKALEQVESRLSKIEGLLAGGAGASSAPAGAAAGGASVDAFDALVAAHIPKFVADSKTIAADVGELVRGHFGHLGDGQGLSRPTDSFSPPISTFLYTIRYLDPLKTPRCAVVLHRTAGGDHQQFPANLDTDALLFLTSV